MLQSEQRLLWKFILVTQSTPTVKHIHTILRVHHTQINMVPQNKQSLRRGVLNTTLCDKVCQWLAAGLWFSPGTLVSSTNKTDCHNITEILLKVTLYTINPTNTLKIKTNYPHSNTNLFCVLLWISDLKYLR